MRQKELASLKQALFSTKGLTPEGAKALVVNHHLDRQRIREASRFVTQELGYELIEDSNDPRMKDGSSRNAEELEDKALGGTRPDFKLMWLSPKLPPDSGEKLRVLIHETGHAIMEKEPVKLSGIELFMYQLLGPSSVPSVRNPELKADMFTYLVQQRLGLSSSYPAAVLANVHNMTDEEVDSLAPTVERAVNEFVAHITH